MHDRIRDLHETPLRRHGSATLDVEADAATLTICESTRAGVGTLEGAVLHPDWREQETERGTRWSAGVIPNDADAAALLVGELGRQIADLGPGPRRRMLCKQVVAFAFLAHLLDGES